MSSKNTSTTAEETMEMIIPGQKTGPISRFLKILWKIVNDPDVEDIIGWNSLGNGFIIYDQVKFVRDLLPLYFQHNNLSSFIRQLCIYDFHKVANINTQLEYTHSYFLKGSPETLSLITRKSTRANQKQENNKEAGEVVIPAHKAISIPLFLQKLWKIVNDPNVEHIIGWNNTGNAFVIYDQEKVTELLPQFFKHNSLASFIRELNIYNFHRVANSEHEMEFEHSYFLKGSPESLTLISRKIYNKSRTNENQENVKKWIQGVKENIDNTVEILTPKQKAGSVPVFLQKLWKIVNDPNVEHTIGWNNTGNGFIIYDQIKFITELLPQYFQHNNLASFIRQLHLYGFHKVFNFKNHQVEFAQSHFLKGSPETLALITRKYGKSRTNHKQENNKETIEMVIPEQKAKSVPTFLRTLWEMVNDPNTEHIIGWNSTDDGFVIYDQIKVLELLSEYYKHNNLLSFVRQLNLYGFRKVVNNKREMEFEHSCFLKASPEPLALIKTKTITYQKQNVIKYTKSTSSVNVIPEKNAKSVPFFLQKLWTIVNDPKTDHIIGWNDTGEGFIIYDKGKVTELLKQYFKHNNLTSFIRQLNIYGFRKVANIEHELEYEHSCFLKGSAETLALITNKKHILSITVQKVENVEEYMKDVKENTEKDVEMITLVSSISSTSTSTSAQEHAKEITKVVIPKQTQESIPLFVQKLWSIVNDSNTDHIIGWNDPGDRFIIYDKGKVTELLPHYFKHKNLTSFTRQLNIYNFQRVANSKHELEYEHSCFHKGSPETLPLITNKKHVLSTTNQKVVNVEEYIKDVKENTEGDVEMKTLVPSISSTRSSRSAEEHVKEITKVVIPKQTVVSIPLFVQKLWSIVNDPNIDHIIGWNDTGCGFIIYDKEKLTELLPQYFKHNNLTSFIKQLNNYDFRKLANDKHELEYEHSSFLKGSPEMLALITKKKHILFITNRKVVNVEECIKDVNENSEEAVENIEPVQSISSTSTFRSDQITNVVIPEQTVESIQLFVQKLWSIVNDPNTDQIIRWNNTGDGFIVHDKREVTEFFSQYFRHYTWHTFISQLSIYNFYKTDRHEMEYKHSYFLQGSPETLGLITNKRNVKSVTDQNEEYLKKRFKGVQENIEESVPLFVLKLWKIVDDPNTEHIIGWNNTGDGFIIYDTEKVTQLLSQYFKHDNLASFIRQLNLYDFHKVVNNMHELQFEHSCFLKDSPETLALITNKNHVLSITNQKVVNVKEYSQDFKENSEEAVEVGTMVTSISSTSTPPEEHVTETTKVVIPGQTAESIPWFVRKLWNIVNDPNTDHIIGWNNTGDGFIIYDSEKVTKLLPQYFKHNSLLSFITQLNQFGIHKVVNNKHEMEFEHSCFHKGLPEALVLITKKKQNMRKLMKYLKEMTSKVSLIDKEIRLLKQENVALWSEIESLNIKYAQLS